MAEFDDEVRLFHVIEAALLAPKAPANKSALADAITDAVVADGWKLLTDTPPGRRILLDPADEQTVERVARAIYLAHHPGRGHAWGAPVHGGKVPWLDEARAVLAELGKEDGQ